MDSYLKFMTDSVLLLKGNPETQEEIVRAEMNDVLQFEIRLAQV